MVWSLSHFHFQTPKDVVDDQFCNELKFFAKMIYVITGYCHIERDELIQLLVPISHMAGYLSIICWLFAQLPQVIKNHERKSVDGVSLAFLLCWFGGDFLNFASCIMTRAMSFQILLSGYYCIIDFILGTQCYYYSLYASKHPTLRLKKNQRLRTVKTPRTLLRHKLRQMNDPNYEEIDTDRDGIPNIPVQHILIPINNLDKSTNDSTTNSHDQFQGSSYSQSTSMSFSKMISSSFIMGFSKVQGAPLYENNQFSNSTIDVETVGKIMAWSCTVLYLSSRIPQLITNYKNKTTKGVSILLFLAALSGNVLYSVSLITCQEALEGGDVTINFWNRQLSYFLGASLTVVFDLVMLYQWYCWDYGVRKPRRTPGTRSSRVVHSPIVPVNSAPMSLSDTIEIMRSPVVMLSPHHARKLYELTPLSPHDFLIDNYLGGKQQEGISGSGSTSRSQEMGVAQRIEDYGSF